MITIKKQWDNGYGCGCCGRQWETKTRYETLEEALKGFPIQVHPDEDDDTQLRSLTVRDGRKKIGWALVDRWRDPLTWKGLHPVLGEFTATCTWDDANDIGLWSCANNPEWYKLLQAHNQETLQKALKGAEEELEYEQRRVAGLKVQIADLKEKVVT